jgi:Tfp pilus assembly protein PilF
MTRLGLAAALAAFACMLAGCGEMPQRSQAMEIADRPADRALRAGIHAYDDGQYAQAEPQLEQALQLGLPVTKDRVAAHKHLAFIYCTSRRIGACETEFRAARRADPGFTLSRSEAGHPLWGPVWQRVQQP